MSQDKDYQKIQEVEAATWCIPDEATRLEKLQRETIRYPYMAKQMGLNFLDTSSMLIWDIGGGPVGLSSILPCKGRIVVDPLTDKYSQYFDTSLHVWQQAEDLQEQLSVPDLIIITNALDHLENPVKFLKDLVKYMKAGSYFAHYHAINNAITHPHEAHAHSINPEIMHNILDTDFETCWELKYPEIRYAWTPYKGKVGQPAFCTLFRKTTGYK